MVEQYIGEIRLFAGNYAPEGWAMCDGTLIPITGNEALYSLIGTLYGSGTGTFGLPDMRSRTPICSGSGPVLTARTLGQSGGVESVAITAAQLPAHNHNVTVSTTTTGSVATATSATYLGVPVSSQPSPVCYLPNAASGLTVQPLNSTVVTSTGSDGAHTNLQPYLAIRYIIATTGLYPTAN